MSSRQQFSGIDCVDERMKTVWSPNASHGLVWSRSEQQSRHTLMWCNIKQVFERLLDPEIRARILENSATSINNSGVFPLWAMFTGPEFYKIETMCKRLDQEASESLV